MDPNEVYKEWWNALVAQNREVAIQKYHQLKVWLTSGGFEPAAFGHAQAKKQFYQFDAKTGTLK